MELVLHNYFSYVYPALEVYSPPYTASSVSTLIYLLVTLFITSVVVTVWMY